MKSKVSEILIKLRGERSQKEIASKLGISSSALSNYEQGLRIPRDEIKKRIAKLYKKDISKIFFVD